MVRNCPNCKGKGHGKSQCPYPINNHNNHNHNHNHNNNILQLERYINEKPEIVWSLLWRCSGSQIPSLDNNLFNQWYEYYRNNPKCQFQSINDVKNISISFQEGIDEIPKGYNRSIFLVDNNCYNVYYNEWLKTTANLYCSRQNFY